MAFTVKARDIARALGEARYLEGLAYKALERPDDKKYLVDTEYEQKVLQGNFVGRGAESSSQPVRFVKPGGQDYCKTS